MLRDDKSVHIKKVELPQDMATGQIVWLHTRCTLIDVIFTVLSRISHGAITDIAAIYGRSITVGAIVARVAHTSIIQVAQQT